ncbi:hypothetical protein ACH5RR_009114 [Cinchona calisaya]|uniref:FBD domain-containing protein n=1 Tax=Cinchona calisaya TaxID=153742 RepID=A0ABD3AGA8_9GENT
MDDERQKGLEIPQEDDDVAHVDRITTLLDHLLSHILSFLATKQAAITSLVSTRWRYAFASVPDIFLYFEAPTSNDDHEVSNFADFGNRLILVDLNFTPNSVVALPNRKLLRLQGLASVVDNSFRQLIQGCPLLEEIKLGCPMVEQLYICRLNCRNSKGEVLQVSVSIKFSSRLQIFNIWITFGDAYAVDFIENLKSPLRTRIGVQTMFKDETESSSYRVQQAFELINDLQCAESLCHSDCTMEALYYSPDLLPTFKILNSLHVEIGNKPDEPLVDPITWWKMLPRLLELAPNLEVLVIDRVFWKMFERDRDFECLLPVAMPAYFIQHLREIEIAFFYGLDNEFTLVEYILQNGKSLQKLTFGQEINPPLDSEKEDCNRILSFNKCSKDCQIVFKWEQNYYRFCNDILEKKLFTGIVVVFLQHEYGILIAWICYELLSKMPEVKDNQLTTVELTKEIPKGSLKKESLAVYLDAEVEVVEDSTVDHFVVEERNDGTMVALFDPVATHNEFSTLAEEQSVIPVVQPIAK